MLFLLINGPNLNILGRRDRAVYGSATLEDLEEEVRRRAEELGVEVSFFQSNSEGLLVDYLQKRAAEARGIIINPGALTHYGLSLREALVDTRLPVVEVHLSNIYGREEWRAKSMVTPIAVGQVSGLGLRGYLYALDFLAAHIREEGTA
ncbi:MAG: type II 3-dehydroquinate dehydratase [Chloroflexi bacterium]|nr:type II 3-dehydroquinate dehydratase [Chloroflexota bacterium]